MHRQFGWMAASAALAIASVTCLPLRPSLAAENISVSLESIELLTVPVSELETFVTTGNATGNLGSALTLLSTEERTFLQELLGAKVKVRPVPFGEYLESNLGEGMLGEFGKLFLPSDRSLSGTHALRVAMRQASTPGEFTFLDVVKAYPTQTMVLDANRVRTVSKDLDTFGNDLKLLLAAFGVEVDTSDAKFDLAEITSLIRAAGEYEQEVDQFIKGTGLTEAELRGNTPPQGTVTVQKADLYRLYQNLDQLVQQAKDSSGVKVKVKPVTP